MNKNAIRSEASDVSPIVKQFGSPFYFFGNFIYEDYVYIISTPPPYSNTFYLLSFSQICDLLLLYIYIT